MQLLGPTEASDVRSTSPETARQGEAHIMFTWEVWDHVVSALVEKVGPFTHLPEFKEDHIYCCSSKSLEKARRDTNRAQEHHR